MRKLLEAFFRHKLLILLPTVLVPMVVTPIVIMSTPAYYESVSGVWVQNPTYLDVKGTPAFTSAAVSQSNQISELLHTRAFMIDVVNRTSLAPLLQTRSGEARVQDLIDKGVMVTAVAGGTHLITIRTRFSTAQVAVQVAQAIIDAYKQRMSDDQLNQSGVAISFFQSQLQSAQDDLTKASQAYSQYAIAMGYASAGDGTPLSPDAQSMASVDSTFADLQATQKFAQQQVEQSRAALQSAEQSSAAAAQGADVGFEVLDPPQLPTAPTPQLKSILVFVLAALVIGLGISGTLLVLLVAGDRSVRRESDLQPPVRVLGVVPALRVKQRLPKPVRSAATRRAIGFAAGTALPAPKGAK
jgi:uncharacterized protein involved in exopolysaccharide biosynthesis